LISGEQRDLARERARRGRRSAERIERVRKRVPRARGVERRRERRAERDVYDRRGEKEVEAFAPHGRVAVRVGQLEQQPAALRVEAGAAGEAPGDAAEQRLVGVRRLAVYDEAPPVVRV